MAQSTNIARQSTSIPWDEADVNDIAVLVSNYHHSDAELCNSGREGLEVCLNNIAYFRNMYLTVKRLVGLSRLEQQDLRQLVKMTTAVE